VVAKSASFGHGSLVCGLWLAVGGLGGSVPTYVLGTFYIRFFLYQCYDIPVSGEAHCISKYNELLVAVLNFSLLPKFILPK
jgi:hypothetical protein